MVVGTLIKINNANKKHESVNEIIWAFVVTGGIAADIISIPWFISAAKNKKRAATVAITSQKILWYKKNNISFITQLSSHNENWSVRIARMVSRLVFSNN